MTGDSELDDIFPAVYEELRRVARRHVRGESAGHTLGTTALVHEAYLALAKLEHIRWPAHAYMLAAASRAMRRILIDHAVSRHAQIRGGVVGGESLDDAVVMAVSRGDELLALDEALDRLAAANERCARAVECRFFGGDERGGNRRRARRVATVKRDWTYARAWLNRELAG